LTENIGSRDTGNVLEGEDPSICAQWGRDLGFRNKDSDKILFVLMSEIAEYCQQSEEIGAHNTLQAREPLVNRRLSHSKVTGPNIVAEARLIFLRPPGHGSLVVTVDARLGWNLIM
jgi:hypothetical protein